jgi:hypothetical protein
MRRRPRTRRVLKWVGTVACVLVFTAWALSTKWSLAYVGQPVCLDVIRGGVTVDRFRALDMAMFNPCRQGYWRVRTLSRIDPPVWSPSLGIWHARFHGRVSAFILPLWIPLALLATPTIILWCHDRRRIPSGHCQTCGYDLTGNVSGICPECGTPVKREGKSA